MTEKDFLEEYDITKYDRPSIATDIVLFTLDNSIKNAKKVNVGPLQILLIKRASNPFKGQCPVDFMRRVKHWRRRQHVNFTKKLM